MIRSLDIRGLVVIDHAELVLPMGLSVITGETGAGKTVVAQALGLLAGAAADSDQVRPGAKHALVQATLALPDGYWEALDPNGAIAPLRELLDDEAEVTVARRVPAEGRARALVDGQAAPREAVAALARSVVRFSGQHEQRRLVSSAAQMAALDAFAGQEVVDLATRLTALRRRLAAAARAVAAARARGEAVARERDQLEQLVADADEVVPDLAEHAGLLTDRDRSRHSARLAEAAAAAAEALSSGDSGLGAVDVLGTAAGALEGVADIDAALAGPLAEIMASQSTLQEVAATLHTYLEDLDTEPGRLDVIEGRLEQYSRFERRWGPGLEAALDRVVDARQALADLREGGSEIELRLTEHATVLAETRELADALYARRSDAGPLLAEAVVAELAELAMDRAEFRAVLEQADDDSGVARQTCTFLLRANPGLPEAPLALAASGGELSRVLLALHGVASQAGAETWDFDEVDAGIGGVTATAVAAKLARLAEGRQVIVITHLPQVAARADAHFRLVKGTDAAGLTTTRIDPLDGDDLVAELCRMLGAAPTDTGARRHAKELLARRGG